MLFGVWWNPLTWLSDGLEVAQGAALHVLRSLCYALCTMIYKLIIYLYNLFINLCGGRILSNEALSKLSTRIGYILGVIMLFYVVLSFIQILLDPDKISDKDKGAVGIIKRVIIVIVMLGVSNYTFQLLYTIQSTVISNNLVSKILLPYEVDTNKFGGVLSAELLTSFYRVSDELVDSDDKVIVDDDNVRLCQQYTYSLKSQIVDSYDFALGETCLGATTEYTDASGQEREMFIIDYNWLISIVAGCFAVYILFSYCIKVGVRMIQLALLEIISPMAFVSYLSPKQDNMFSKWMKMYTSTYIDVFIRIAIINFAVYLIAIIFGSGSDTSFWNSMSVSDSTTENFIKVIMILALLTFAKRAPELIKELFPSGGAGSLGFGGMSTKDILGGGIIKKAPGIAVGAATGAAVGMVTAGFGREGFRNKLTGMAGGAVSGLFRGGKAGSHGGNPISGAAKAQWGKMKEANEAYNGGASFFNRVGTKAVNAVSAGQTAVAGLERRKRQQTQQRAQIQNRKAQIQNSANQRKNANTQLHQGEINRLQRQNKSYGNSKNIVSGLKNSMLNRAYDGKSDAMKLGSVTTDLRDAKAKVEYIQEQLKHTNNQASIHNLNIGLAQAQQNFKDAQDAYLSNFIEGVHNGNIENNEINSQLVALETEIASNRDLYAGQNVDSWDDISALSDHATAMEAGNTNVILEHQVAFDNENERIELDTASAITNYDEQIAHLDEQIAQLDESIENAKNGSGPIFGGHMGGPGGGGPGGGPGPRPH